MPDGDFRRVIPELSLQQCEARDAILDWIQRDDAQVYHLGGFAGTGKTHLAVQLGLELGAQFAAFTGKAASVLRQRGAENASTLHSLLYGAPTVEGGELRWPRKSVTARLIVADECATIDHTLGRDLLRTGAKLLVTGDQFQLPPVAGKAFFTGPPDFVLSEVHRQAANSQPLQLATAIREGTRHRGQVPFDIDAAADADIVICGLNRTRRLLNKMIRGARGITSKNPVVGDRLVCLRNNAKTGLFNGSLWTVVEVEHRGLLARMTIVDDIGTEAAVTAHSDGWFCSKLNNPFDPEYRKVDLFDFGWCLTCHRAQGSEWQRVVVIDETDSPAFELIAGDMLLKEFKRRWMYTGVTRAKSAVTVMEVPR